jgi:hypothetical protein
VTWFPDHDGDGVGNADMAADRCEQLAGWVPASRGEDCADGDATRYPGAPEVCDGVDQDCDRMADDWAVDAQVWPVDADDDGYGDAGGETVHACEPPEGYAWGGGDCDDRDPSAHLYASEYCDYVDNDCDGLVDDGLTIPAWFYDADRDGWGDELRGVTACRAPVGPFVSSPGDCDDGAVSVHPTGYEIANGIDDDCDGAIDEDGDLG